MVVAMAQDMHKNTQTHRPTGTHTTYILVQSYSIQLHRHSHNTIHTHNTIYTHTHTHTLACTT